MIARTSAVPERGGAAIRLSQQESGRNLAGEGARAGKGQLSGL